MPARHDDTSGISVYPRLPVPGRDRFTGDASHSRLAPRKPRHGRVIAMVAAAAIAGGAGAWFLQPAIAPDGRIAAALQRAAEAEQAAKASKDRADSLETSLDLTAGARREAEAKLAVAEAARTELADRDAAIASERQAVAAIQAQLRAAVDSAADAVITSGREVHLRIAERLLFRPGDDALSDRGKAVLGKLAAALRELPDELVWVQGHTDELPAPAAAPARAAGKKSGKPAPPAPRFATSWELSAARALAVVHYLQDIAKLDPSRLAALAFGPYAPISKTDRAANRRVEIVITRRPPAG